MFVRFVDISNTLLSTSLRRGSTLDDLLVCTLMLAKDVAKSDVELVCLRVGDELRCRAPVAVDAGAELRRGRHHARGRAGGVTQAAGGAVSTKLLRANSFSASRATFAWSRRQASCGKRKSR